MEDDALVRVIRWPELASVQDIHDAYAIAIRALAKPDGTPLVVRERALWLLERLEGPSAGYREMEAA
jgi:hypothetical protein